MIRAFISHIDVGTDLDLASFAADIQDDLTAAGYDVKSTLPWNPDAAPTLSPLLPPVQAALPLPPSPPSFS